MNVTDARALAASDSKIRAAVTEDFAVPQTARAEVELFTLVKDATAHFKQRFDALIAEGYDPVAGTASKGYVIFDREDGPCSLFLQKRPNPSKGGSTA